MRARTFHRKSKSKAKSKSSLMGFDTIQIKSDFFTTRHPLNEQCEKCMLDGEGDKSIKGAVNIF